MSETSSILVLIFGTVLFTLFAVFTILYIALQKKKQYHHHIEKKEMEHRFSKQMMESRLEVQEQVLNDLSIELHNNVTHVLNTATFQLYMLEGKTDPEQWAVIDQAAGHVQEMTAALRDMSHTMNSIYVSSASLEESIEKEAERVTKATGINCNFDHPNKTGSINDEQKVILFRIIQELISNAIKHGKPTSLSISLTYTSNSLSATVTDDGAGFDMNEQTDGIGLANIKDRIALLKGEVHIRSAINKGTSVNLSVPAELNGRTG